MSIFLVVDYEDGTAESQQMPSEETAIFFRDKLRKNPDVKTAKVTGLTESENG